MLSVTICLVCLAFVFIFIGLYLSLILQFICPFFTFVVLTLSFILFGWFSAFCNTSQYICDITVEKQTHLILNFSKAVDP